MYKIIVAHPSRQHSYRVAEALKREGMLLKYVTRVYNTPRSFLFKLVSKVLHGNNLTKVLNRKSDELTLDDVVLMNELSGYIQIGLSRIDRHGRIYARYLRWSVKRFAVRVAKYAIKEAADAVIFYDTAAYWGMKYIKDRNVPIVCIMDNAQTPRNYLYKIYNESKEACGKYWKTLEGEDFLLDYAKSLFYGKEVQMGDYHIAASGFSKAGLIYSGVSPEKISVVPYGVDKDRFRCGDKLPHERLEVLYVGHINQRKGICQLLETAGQLENENIHFRLVGGGRDSYPDLFPDGRKNVEYSGQLLGQELADAYRNADLFVFPVMGEGFGLVLLEAMASGLPVLASRNCGAPELVTDGENGFLIDACNTQQLVEKLRWIMDHKEELPRMGERARKTAEQYTWKRYNAGIIQAVKHAVEGSYES